jgi:hypothetical protein
MSKRFFVVPFLLLSDGGVFGQDKGDSRPPKSEDANSQVAVDILFATEHVPAGLKPGVKVVLSVVSGKTVTKKGVVAYNLRTVASDLEVVSVTAVEKPKGPEQAVKVQLRVAKPMAARIERLKAQTVKTATSTPGGPPILEEKPVTLRLELPPPPKKTPRS